MRFSELCSSISSDSKVTNRAKTVVWLDPVEKMSISGAKRGS